MIDYSEFRQWMDALYRHPEWREELRRVVLTDEILELPAFIREMADMVRELVEMQKRTEQRVEELAEAQRRSEERIGRLETAVAELAEAQRRTEQRLEEWAEAQRRTDRRVEELAEAQRGLGVAVGALQRVIGATVEEEAAAVTEVVLRRKGYRLRQPAFSLPLDGEIDVVLPLEDPSGKQIWAVVEAKARLTGRDVHTWSQRMHELTWHQRLAQKDCPGPYLVYAYGIRIDLSAQEVAQKEGVGLIKSDGEILAPPALLESLVADTNK